MNMENQKRRYIVQSDTEVDENNNKRKRIIRKKTKLIQLNDYCLEHVFLNLQLKDLGNIAASNIRFLDSANYVYTRRHAETVIVFDPFASNRNMFNNFINILQVFGDKIKKLQVAFYDKQRFRNRNKRILELINKKCSKSVTELKLSNVQCDMIISQPFLHLKKFTLNDSYFTNSLAHFIRNAPNIVWLEFYSVENVFNPIFVEQKVPLMKHFGNYNQVITDSELENLQKFRQFMNVNEQLTSLGMGEKELEMIFHYEDVRKQFFKTIHRKLPYPDHSGFITYLLPFESLYFGQLNQLSLSMGYSTEFLLCMRKNRTQIVNLPLQQLEYCVGHLNMESVDFIVNCSRLEKLQLYVFERLDMINFASIVFGSGRLTELEVFLAYDVNPKYSDIPDLMNIIVNNYDKQLRKIVVGFKIQKPSRTEDSTCEQKIADYYATVLFDSFSKNLPNQWRINFETRNTEIKQQHLNKTFFCCAILEKYSN